jgi:hypothetical protein
LSTVEHVITYKQAGLSFPPALIITRRDAHFNFSLQPALTFTQSESIEEASRMKYLCTSQGRLSGGHERLWAGIRRCHLLVGQCFRVGVEWCPKGRFKKEKGRKGGNDAHDNTVGI